MSSRAALLGKARALCDRDEVKDWIHGVLVAKMEALHARRPELATELDERPDHRR